MTDLKPSFPSDSDVLAVFHEELARAAEKPDGLGSGPALWPRFAAYYRTLARLWRFLVCFLAMLFLGSQAQAIDSDDLAMAVTASGDPVVPGNILLYQLTATNRGVIPTSGEVTVTAFIPGHTDGVSVTDGGACGFCFAGQRVTWSLANLPPGGSRTVGLSVRVLSGSSAPPDGTLILQQATVTSEGVSANTERSVIVEATPELSLSMRADRDPIDPGALLTYSLVFGNRGGFPAPGVTLRARVPAGTSFQSASDGGTQSGGVVTWSLGTIGVGQSGERRFTVIVDAGIAAGELLLSDAEILDTAAPSNRARSTTATAVNGNSKLVLSLTAGPDPIAPGGILLYQLTATNRGVIPTSGEVTVTAFIPGHTDGVSVTDGGACGFCFAGQRVTWSLANLPPGGSRTVGLSVRVLSGSSAPPDGTLILQQATVTSEGGSASAAAVSRVCAGGGTSCDLTPPPQPPQADLSITKADPPDPVFVSQPLTYTLTVRNNGPNDAAGVTVTDPLPGGVVFVSAAASQGGCSGTATVTCFLGNLAIGASPTVTIVVSPLSPGALSNTASVSGSPSDPNPGNNSATTATTVLPIPPIRADLALTQTDAPDPGAVNDPLLYTLTATNHGPSPATGVQLTDNLPPGVLLTGPPRVPARGPVRSSVSSARSPAALRPL